MTTVLIIALAVALVAVWGRLEYSQRNLVKIWKDRWEQCEKEKQGWAERIHRLEQNAGLCEEGDSNG